MNDNINELQDQFKAYFDTLTFPSSPKNLYEPIRFTLDKRGKAVRPLLVLMACDLFDGDIQATMSIAAAVELFHNFTLIHDDIMDDAPLRRGYPSVYKKWGSNIAILSGDALYSFAVQVLARCNSNKLPEILELFTTTALQVCEGQQMDMDFEAMENVSLVEYEKMIELKTAVLLAASLKLGGLMANISEEQQTHLYEMGRSLGMAFQMQDDYLDAFGDDSGKRKGGDILSDKKTFLLLKAQEQASGESAVALKAMVGNKGVEPEAKIESVLEVYRQTGVDAQIRAEVAELTAQAHYHLGFLKANETKKQDFSRFFDQLLNRTV